MDLTADGSIIDSWPRSYNFVHINELGELSPGMLEVYLPVRQAGFEELMMEIHATHSQPFHRAKQIKPVLLSIKIALQKFGK